jgi:hypothetical protein
MPSKPKESTTAAKETKPKKASPTAVKSTPAKRASPAQGTSAKRASAGKGRVQQKGQPGPDEALAAVPRACSGGGLRPAAPA